MRVLGSAAVELTTCTFAAEQQFLASADDGGTLLRSIHLRAVIGRELSEDERRGLPAGLPDVICPL